MLTYLKALWASVQVIAELWKVFKEYTDAVEVAGNGDEKRRAVFGLLGNTFELCEKYLVDTPLDGEDIRNIADRVWGVWETFCVAIGKFKKGSIPVAEPNPEPVEEVVEDVPAEETPSEEVA